MRAVVLGMNVLSAPSFSTFERCWSNWWKVVTNKQGLTALPGFPTFVIYSRISLMKSRPTPEQGRWKAKVGVVCSWAEGKEDMQTEHPLQDSLYKMLKKLDLIKNK